MHMTHTVQIIAQDGKLSVTKAFVTIVVSRSRSFFA
jgi:hypothetical protein